MMGFLSSIILSIFITANHAFVSVVLSSPPHHRMLSTAIRGGDNDNNGNADALNKGELVSALARLDKAWSIQQANPKTPKSRWTKVEIKEDDDLSSSSKFCYVLEPPNASIPSCCICFLGGAGLGQFPHVAYNELLTRLSDRLNAAVLTAPYSVGLNHWELAKSTGEILRKAQLQCEEERQYPNTLPTYGLSHSLGCKLSALYMAATGRDYDGVGFIAFNNFGFSDTIGLVRELARQVKNNNNNEKIPSMDPNMWNQIFDMAETAVSALGVDFTPTPSELQLVLQSKYSTQENAKKTRLFVMDDDTLDTSQNMIDAVDTVTVSNLPGTHLSPVYVKLSLEDVMKQGGGIAADIDPEISDFIKQEVGYQSASFGNEEDLNCLVEEIVGYIYGKPPSKKVRPLLTTSKSDKGDDV
mmetsp:Transcript_20066/g.29775  ORF Transcript_20066/g.29775 Transcript_20066/m.29775 type:complete len:413 (-) Transcript_20066:30-1268(-)